jgi:hypothetical protein
MSVNVANSSIADENDDWLHRNIYLVPTGVDAKRNWQVTWIWVQELQVNVYLGIFYLSYPILQKL